MVIGVVKVLMEMESLEVTMRIEECVLRASREREADDRLSWSIGFPSFNANCSYIYIW